MPLITVDMPSCQHLGLNTHTATYRIHNPANPDAPFFTVAIRVQCASCGTFFRFLGDSPGMPQGGCPEAIERRLGCWVSDMGDELGAMIAPLDASEPLAQVAVLGRA